MMNIKQIKSVLIKIWVIVFLVLFSTWLIGGCIYNSIGKERKVYRKIYNS